jgi:hypothetical protein
MIIAMRERQYTFCEMGTTFFRIIRMNSGTRPCYLSRVDYERKIRSRKQRTD